MMDDLMAPKARIKSRRPRPRASNEIDVIPPEVFAIGGGFRRPKNDHNTNNSPQVVGEESPLSSRNDKPSEPQQVNCRASPREISVHMDIDSGPIVNTDAGVKNNFHEPADDEIKEDPQHAEIVIITTDFSPSDMDQGHSNQVNASPSNRRAMMSQARAMSEITLNASQHPEPKKDDIELSPLSRHIKKGYFKKSPKSPRGKLVSAALHQLYPDYTSQHNPKERTVSNQTASHEEGVLIDNDESYSSTGDYYDGFEDDSYNNETTDRDEIMRSERSISAHSPKQLTPLREESSSEMSGPFRKHHTLFSWSKREHRSNQSPRSKSKKFPSFKKVSVRRFLSPSRTKPRDGTAVAAG